MTTDEAGAGGVAALSFGQTALLAAAGEGDVGEVERLLDNGADINGRSRWWAGGFGVLDVCAPAMADLLIARGAQVDAHAAARLGLLDLLRARLSSDADAVHARGGDGKTALHVATSIAAADMLLDAGADIDALDIDHESTPAQHLIGEHAAVAAHLVERGCRTDLLLAAALGDGALAGRHLDADPACAAMRVTDAWFPMRDARAGGTIYRWTLGWNVCSPIVARARGHDALASELMSHLPPGMALSVACETGDGEWIAAAVARNAETASRIDKSERTQIVAMAELGNHDGMMRMLAHGWPADVTAAHGQTALHWCAFHGDVEGVRALLTSGADAAAKDAQYQSTPLGWAEHGRTNSWFCGRGDYDATIRALNGS